MSKFNPGDKVLINGALVAVIQTYSEENDRIAYVSTPPGGGTDTTYGHISQTRVQLLVNEAQGADVEAPARHAEPEEDESVEDAE